MEGNPTMDLNPVLRGVAIPLSMLNAKTPDISYGRLGLFPLLYVTVCLQNKSPFRTLAKTSRTINNSQRSLKVVKFKGYLILLVSDIQTY